MATRDGTFYSPWPLLDGKTIQYQWGEIRSNQAELKAIARASVQELEDGTDELNAYRTLLGTMYGDLTFRNKFRFFYNKTTKEMTIQKNDGTVDTPIWTDVVQIRHSDGQFQVVSVGGISSSAGFYGPGLQTIEEVAESSTSADVSIRNPSKIFFNSDDGFGVQEISSGSNKGQPEIVFTQPFGKAQSFSKAGKEWQVDHNFGITPVLVQVMDRDDRVVIPDKADVSDPNTAYFYFNEPFTGSVYIASGGVGAASLKPRDPFYLVVRDHLTPASPNNTLKPNADMVFDAEKFYVDVDLDENRGGAHKKAIIRLKEGAGVTFTDGSNTYTAATHMNVNDKRFYYSSDANGNPTLNSQFLDRTDFNAHVRMDDTLEVENAVTAESFYVKNGGNIYNDGTDLHIGGSGGQVVFDDRIEIPDGTFAAPGMVFADDTDLGIYRSGTNELAIAAGFGKRFAVGSSVITALRPVIHPVGSAAAPTMTFSGDTNTGAYRVGADIFGISTGGVERLRVGSTLSKFATYVTMDDALGVANAVTAEAYYLAGGSGGEISKSGNDVLIKSDSGQVVIDDDMLVSGKVVSANFYTSGGGFVSPLRMRETDSSPNVANVSEIIVGIGSLADNGDGTVTLSALGDRMNVKDENNVFVEPANITFRNENFYASSDSNGEPMINLQPNQTLDSVTADEATVADLTVTTAAIPTITTPVRMDRSLNVSDTVTAGNFYTNDNGDLRDHGQMTGRGDDDHTQYVLRNQWLQNGFPDASEVSLAWDDGTRTLTLSPTGASFDYFIQGIKYTQTGGSITETITDTSGLWMIYLDSEGVLASINAPSHAQIDIVWTTRCSVAFLLWDGAGDGRLMYELHASNMAPDTHHWLHDHIGSSFLSGMVLADFVADGNGSSNTHAQFSIAAGEFADEDVDHSPAAINQTTAAEIWYRDAGVWKWVTNTGYKVRNYQDNTANRLAYNNTAGSGTQTEVTNGNFVLCHIFATNVVDDAGANPRYIAIQGQDEYSTLNAARTGADTEINNLVFGDLPLEEVVPVGTVIFQTRNSYSNDINARVRTTDSGDNYVDYRASNIKGSGGSISDHGSLAGLADDDHQQYLRTDGTRELTGPMGIVTAEAFYVETGGDWSDSGLKVNIGDVNKLTVADTVSTITTHVRLDDTLEVENVVTAEAFYTKSGGEVPRAYYEDFSAAVEWTVTHNLDSNAFIAQAFKGTGEMVIPDTIHVNDRDVAYFYFATAQDGKAVILGLN